MGLLEGLNEIICEKFLEQYLAHKKSTKVINQNNADIQITSSPPSSTSVHVPDAGPEEDGFCSLGFMWHRNSARFLKDKGNHSNHMNTESPGACILGLPLTLKKSQPWTHLQVAQISEQAIRTGWNSRRLKPHSLWNRPQVF